MSSGAWAQQVGASAPPERTEGSTGRPPTAPAPVLFFKVYLFERWGGSGSSGPARLFSGRHGTRTTLRDCPQLYPSVQHSQQSEETSKVQGLVLTSRVHLQGIHQPRPGHVSRTANRWRQTPLATAGPGPYAESFTGPPPAWTVPGCKLPLFCLVARRRLRGECGAWISGGLAVECRFLRGGERSQREY